MSQKTQSFASHARWLPMFHFIASPITMLNIFVAYRHAMHVGGRYAWWNVVFAFGVATGVFASRVMAVTVQDRLIRLEMRLKLRELLPVAQHGDIYRLSTKQMVALRFAGDAELPALVQRVLKGELVDQKSIKAAITDWQADWQRA